MGVNVKEDWQKVDWNKLFFFHPIHKLTAFEDLLKDYKKVKDLFGEDIYILRKEGENEETERNDVYIYKTVKYPPKSKAPSKD